MQAENAAQAREAANRAAKQVAAKEAEFKKARPCTLRG